MASRLPRIYSMHGVSTVALKTGPRFARRIITFGIEEAFLAFGMRDVNRGNTEATPQVPLKGAVDLTQRAKDVPLAAGFNNDLEMAEREWKAWLDSVVEVNDLIIRAAQRYKLRDFLDITVTSWTGGNVVPAVYGGLDLTERNPNLCSRVLVMPLPAEAGPRDRVRLAPDLPVELVERKVAVVALVFDNDSLICRGVEDGQAHQDDLVATGTISFLAAPFVFPAEGQRAPSDIFRELGRTSPLAAMSFGSRHLVGTEIGWFNQAGKAVGWEPRYRVGDPELAAHTCMLAFRDALTKEERRSLGHPPTDGVPAFCAFALPAAYGRRRDWREFWKPLITRVRAQVKREAPWVTPVFVPGPGTADPKLAASRPFWAQASLIYSIPPRPRPVQGILDRPPLPTTLAQPPRALPPASEEADADEEETGADVEVPPREPLRLRRLPRRVSIRRRKGAGS